MGRLTETDKRGNWRLKGAEWPELREGQVITKKLSERLYGALCKLRDYENTGLSPEEIKALNEFEESNGQKYLMELAKHRWIPVEERLPEEYADVEYDTVSDLVLCTVYDGEKDEYFVSDDCTANRKWCNFEETTGRLKVIAWQPLPEPYRTK